MYHQEGSSDEQESKFNGRHTLTNADDVHLLYKHIYTAKRNRKHLYFTSRKVALEVNAKNVLCVRVSSTY